MYQSEQQNKSLTSVCKVERVTVERKAEIFTISLHSYIYRGCIFQINPKAAFFAHQYNIHKLR